MVKSILIVDDQHEVRRMLRAGIETLDPEFQVLDLPSAEESLVVISMQPVDLLVTDIRLPGISGLELMQKIRKRNPGLKVIVITGLLDPDLLSQVKQAGAEAFFTKPIQMTAFLDAVGRTLGIQSLSEHLEPSLQIKAQTALSLPERLSQLRNELDAVAVVLIDERGETLAQTGELPRGEIESLLVPALASVLSAGTRVAISLKKSVPENLLLFKGNRYNLCVANAGSSYALIVLVDRSGQFPAQIPVVVDSAVQDLLSVLPQPLLSSLPTPPHAPKIEVPEEDLEDFEETLERISGNKIGADELDQFWENLAGNNLEATLGNASVLTYDQASKLGLTPERK
jgi:FixJ family two-component response regulator